MDVTFSSRSVQELQNFLKLRGVLITGQRKLDLVRLCQAAQEISIEIDPDGFLEEREEVIGGKHATVLTVIDIFLHSSFLKFNSPCGLYINLDIGEP